MTEHPTNNRVHTFCGIAYGISLGFFTAVTFIIAKDLIPPAVDGMAAALHPGQRPSWRLTYKEGEEIKHAEYRTESGCIDNMRGQKASCEKVWEKILSYDEMVEKADGYRKSNGTGTCEETCGHYTLWMDDEVQCVKNTLPDNRDWYLEYLYACKNGNWVKK